MPRVFAEADGLVTLTCPVCQVAILVEPEGKAARIWHHPDGAHRIMSLPGLTLSAATRDPGQADLYQAVRQARIDLLAVAVRLAEVSEDLDRTVEALDRLESLAL